MFSVIASIPFILVNFYIPTGIDIVYLFFTALTGSLGQIFLTYAYKSSPASEIAIYEQVSVVFAIVLGFLFLNQIPTLNALIGGVLILVASLIAFIYNASKQKNIDGMKM